MPLQPFAASQIYGNLDQIREAIRREWWAATQHHMRRYSMGRTFLNNLIRSYFTDLNITGIIMLASHVDAEGALEFRTNNPGPAANHHFGLEFLQVLDETFAEPDTVHYANAINASRPRALGIGTRFDEDRAMGQILHSGMLETARHIITAHILRAVTRRPVIQLH